MIAVYAMNTAYAIVFNDSKVSNNITMINQIESLHLATSEVISPLFNLHIKYI